MRSALLYAVCLVGSVICQPLVAQSSGEMSSAQINNEENSPPELTGYVNAPGGVKPDEGYSGDTFFFGVSYRDKDGDPCVRCEVWVDQNKNGIFEEGEKYALEEQKYPQVAFTPYGRKIVIENQRPDTRVQYRFFAFDGKDEAIKYGNFVDPSYVHILSRFVPWVGKGSPEENVKETLAGESFVLEFSVLVRYVSLKDAVLDWDAFVGGADFGPAEVVGTSIHESYFNKPYDKVTLRILLRASSDAQEETYVVQAPPLPFSFATNDRRGEIKWNDAVSYEVKPYLTKGPDVSRVSGYIGGPIFYEFTVFLGSGSKPEDVIDFEADQITMHPFSVLDARVERAELKGGVHRVRYRLKIALFKRPGAYEIPALELGAVQLPSVPFTLNAVDPFMKIPENNLEVIWFIREQLKGAAEIVVGAAPDTYAGGKSLVRASVVIATLVFVFVGGYIALALFERVRRLRQRERISACREQYEQARIQYRENPSRGNLSKAYHSLRTYVFVHVAMEDKRGYSARQLAEDKAIAPAAPHGTLDELAVLEDIYFREV